MPKVGETVKDFFGKEPNRSVNPDEAVASGAAIQGAVLTGTMKDIVLIDVTPLSLGTELVGDVFSRIIPRNTPIPARRSNTYTTAFDNQTTVPVAVYQGEREIASKNKLLGTFSIVGLPMAPRGVPQLKVSFDLDANGMVQCHAIDERSGK